MIKNSNKEKGLLKKQRDRWGEPQTPILTALKCWMNIITEGFVVYITTPSDPFLFLGFFLSKRIPC